ncbi:vitamin K epoxide reductase family protein [Flavobacterium sp. HJSW_4]|uniref:vitamin K epoxide reductase family protein n=1 Tax=Flavobacterium sp. HJSW_4 TaxID=3344660 RepID=UPI0035F31746
MPDTVTRENFNYIFQYLQKEEIVLPKSDFIFEFESHSEFPSMLAISDTLNLFGVKNAALKVGPSEISDLPDYFLTVLRDGESHPKYHFIEKIENDYFSISEQGKTKISSMELNTRWLNVALLAEKNDLLTKPKSKNLFNAFLIALIGICLSAFLFSSNIKIAAKLFILFPAAGTIFSVISLKSLFDIRSSIIDRFCNSGESMDCEAVTASSKWKLFKKLNFNTLSIVFFTFQLLAYLLLLLVKQLDSYFSIQGILLFSSVPLIIASIYYQKFIVQKWCPTCLAIMATLLFEIGWIFLLDFGANLTLKTIIVHAFIAATTLLIWNTIKKNLAELKKLKESEIKSNKFQRNYPLFRSALLSQKKIELPLESIFLGSDNSPLSFLLILSLKCPHCEAAYKVLKRELNKYESLKIHLILKCDWDNENVDIRKVYTDLLGIYIEEGAYTFTKALDSWFEMNSSDLWLEKYGFGDSENRYTDLLRSQYHWCLKTNVVQTPSVYIMGYRYPNVYDIENIEFFINDLLEDTL